MYELLAVTQHLDKSDLKLSEKRSQQHQQEASENIKISIGFTMWFGADKFRLRIFLLFCRL